MVEMMSPILLYSIEVFLKVTPTVLVSMLCQNPVARSPSATQGIGYPDQ